MEKEPVLVGEDDLTRVLGLVTFKNTVLDFKWRFEYQAVTVQPTGPGAADRPPREGWLLWVSFERPDTLTGEVGRGRGRDEIVWKGTTLSGVVKTCWVLVELMVRHELME